MTTIFVSYNPTSDKEQTQAVRFHTIGAVNGFRMFLPDRSDGDMLSPETKRRIGESHFFIAFLSGSISRTLKAELDEAVRRGIAKNRIILIHDSKSEPKNTSVEENVAYSEFFHDSDGESVNEFYKRIFDTIEKETKPSREQEESSNALGILILAGLAIWWLSTLNRK